MRPKRKQRQILRAIERWLSGIPAQRVARSYRVSGRTIYNWITLYGHTLADFDRRKAQRRPAKELELDVFKLAGTAKVSDIAKFLNIPRISAYAIIKSMKRRGYYLVPGYKAGDVVYLGGTTRATILEVYDCRTCKLRLDGENLVLDRFNFRNFGLRTYKSLAPDLG